MSKILDQAKKLFDEELEKDAQIVKERFLALIKKLKKPNGRT